MNYRTLLKNVEKTLSAIEATGDVASTIVEVGEEVVRNFRSELGIHGGRLYLRLENVYVLERGFGRSRKVPPGLAVPSDYGPIREAEEQGIALRDEGDPSLDAKLEEQLGTRRFAAISFGEQRYLLSFDVHPRVGADDLLLALGIIRTVVDSKVKTEKLEGLMNEARRIQQSILPRSVPRVGDFDVHGVSLAAEAVGGDFFDFLPLGPQTFGVAIADASGHGLLAALLVRDVYVGLRMGIGGDLKIARTIERLNRILNKSRLTTKFISLFYGEVEVNGDIVYVNAGHPPPLHLHAGGSFTELASTGMVLGPAPDSTYARRAVWMEPGDVLVLYTDGIVEAHDARGRELGLGRLKRTIVEGRKLSARELAERILGAAQTWSAGQPPEDDRTVVVIRRAPRKPARASSPTLPVLKTGTPPATPAEG